MRCHITRLVPGQTRFGIFHNLDSADDRAACGWYVCLHCAPWYVEWYATPAKGGR